MTAAVTSGSRSPARTAGRSGLFARLTSRLGGLLLCAAGLVAMSFISLGLGSAELELGTVLDAFTQFDGSNEHLIVMELRLPRTLIGIAVGGSLAVAGGLMQGVTRNALADPGILGINAGASLLVVLAIRILGVNDTSDYVWFAIAGAAVASVLVYALGSVGRGGGSSLRLVLAGAVLSALLASVTSAILILDIDSLDAFRFWVVGSIAGRGHDVLLTVLPFMVIGLLIGLGGGRQLNAMSLGDDVAASLGQRVVLVRTVLSLATVMLAGAAVAAAGPIGFVGLAVPHAARLLAGVDYRWVVAYALFLGPILLLASDVIGRIVARPEELQVGIMTALVGAPVLIWLVRRSRVSEL